MAGLAIMTTHGTLVHPEARAQPVPTSEQVMHASTPIYEAGEPLAAVLRAQ